MKSLFFGLETGLSFTSKLIKFWTRSKRSHAFFIHPEIYDGTMDSLYKHGALIEAWKYPNEPIWKTRVIYSCLSNHSAGTPFTVYELKVSDEQYQKVLEFQNVCAFLEIPYDWKAIVAFVIPFKLKKDGHLFCSEKECLSLKYAGLISEEIPCWKISPDLFEDLLLVAGAKKVADYVTYKF
jgi:hypothetical protein